MLKISKLMLVNMLWLGVYLQAAEEVPTGSRNLGLAVHCLVAKEARNTVPSLATGFTRADVVFVSDAYDIYQKKITEYDKQSKQGALKRFFSKSVDYNFLMKQAAISYCNTLLSRFYRSQLEVMAEAAPVELKEAIVVVCEDINKIGHEFVKVVKKKDIDQIKKQIQQSRGNNTLQIDLNAKNSWYETALTYACQQGSVVIVQILLSEQDASGKVLVDVNAKNNSGFTALMHACEKSSLEIAQALLGVKDASSTLLVDVNAVDIDGNTALMFACFQGSVEIVQELLRVKDASGNVLVDVNAVNSRGYTALMKARNRVDIVRKLLNLKKPVTNQLLVDVNVVDIDGNTALMLACFKGCVDIVKDLLQYGADILHENDERESALDILYDQLADASTSVADRAQIQSILNVFDARKQGLTDAKLAKMGNQSKGILELQEFYVEFQRGKPEKLSERLTAYLGLVPTELLPLDVNDVMVSFTLSHIKQSVFKKESVEPLLQWLIKVTPDKDMKKQLCNVNNECNRYLQQSKISEAEDHE